LVRHREVSPYLTSSELSVHPAQCQFIIDLIINIDIISIMANGRKDFQVMYIRWSYRMRGRVARTQINKAESMVVFITRRALDRGVKGSEDVKKIEVNRHIARILVYSAMKIRANRPLLYSTLNPETNSDSPSAKSNGVRLVSARFVVNHMMASGRSIRLIQDHLVSEITDMSRVFINTRALRRIKDILTSYEIVCATPRKAPSRAYFELEHHPDRNVA